MCIEITYSFDTLNEALISGKSPICYPIISLKGKTCCTIIAKPLAHIKHQGVDFLIYVRIDIATSQHTFFSDVIHTVVTAKNTLDNLNRQQRVYSRLLQRGREIRTQFEFNLAETKAKGFFTLGHLCLLISCTLRKYKLPPIFMTEGCFTTYCKSPRKVRLLLSTETQTGILSSWTITFLKDDSPSL